MMNNIAVMKTSELVDKLAEWDKLTKEAKDEKTLIESELQKRADTELTNKKIKQVKFFGSNGNTVVVTNTESVKLISYQLLKGVLGDIIKDFVKEKQGYDLTDPFKKMVAPIFLGNYVDTSFESVLEQIGLDEKNKKLAKKKLKGNFEKDKAFFESIGMDAGEAEENAYLVKEAIAYDKIVKLFKAAGHEPGTKEFYEALEVLNNAVIVEEGIKIGVEYDEDGSSE